MIKLAENLHIRLTFLGIGRDLGVVVGLARLASFFLLLSQKKETKEKATLSRSTLRCSASWAAIELTLTSHTKRALLRRSDSRLQKTPMKLALLPVHGMSAKCPLLRRDLGAIGAAEWDWMNVKSRDQHQLLMSTQIS